MSDPTKHPDRDDAKMSSEDYEHLLDHYGFRTQEITLGKILKGRVIKRTPTHVLVDVGFKTEGAIPLEEFTDPKALAELRPGSEIEAMLETTDVKDGTATVFTSTDWEHPGAAMWTASPFYVFSTSKLTYECTYNNTGPNANTTVVSGPSAVTNEMCMATGYYFPATKPLLCFNNIGPI